MNVIPFVTRSIGKVSNQTAIDTLHFELYHQTRHSKATPTARTPPQLLPSTTASLNHTTPLLNGALELYPHAFPSTGLRISNRSKTAANRQLRPHFSMNALVRSSLSEDVDMPLVTYFPKMIPLGRDAIQLTPWIGSRFHITDTSPISGFLITAPPRSLAFACL